MLTDYECSQSFTHALYHLAAHPEVASVLHAEVKAVVSKEGWTKSAIDHMLRVDSFLKECQRFNGINACPCFPFTFFLSLYIHHHA